MPGCQHSPLRHRLALFLLGMLPCLCFALYTQHAWEDWYITFRAAKNLALGNGLVFEPGQVLQTFTSPLNVLIPAGLSWLTGNTHDNVVLWLYRLICAAFLGGAVLLLHRMARGQQLSRLTWCFLLVLFLLDGKIMDFSINGQEAAFMMFFLALQLVALLERRTVLLGLAWGGLMWSRPDSFIYIGGVSAGYLLFVLLDDRQQLPATLQRMALAGLVGALVYAPWLLGTTWYYGSPVPHTIIAKGLFPGPDLGTRLLGLLVFPLTGVLNLEPVTMRPTIFSGVFMPTYFVHGGWPEALQTCYRLLAWLAAILWMLPRMPALVRVCSLGAFIGTYYLQFFPPYAFPWYFPSCTLLSILALAGLLEAGLRAQAGPWLRRSVLAAAGVIMLIELGVTLCTAQEMRVQQALIEIGQRKQIGLWLKQHAATPHDTVFLECLGYIGYYSNLKMYDYPGMSSPEMVAARRQYGNDWPKLIKALRPDWIVLRPPEVDAVMPLLGGAYTQAASFDQSAALAAVPFLPGRGYARLDRKFLVYHRVEQGTQSPMVH